MAARGHSVRVVTALPNYPTGRVFDGYRGRVRVVEDMAGVHVVRTWLLPSNSSRSLPRLFSYLTFVMSSVLFGLRDAGHQDVVLIESPPLVLVPAGLLIGRVAKARIVMNVSDIWPEAALRIGMPMPRLALLLMRRLERLGYEQSDLVTATTPAASESIKARFPHVATAVVPSGTDLGMFRPSRRSRDFRRSLGVTDDDLLVGYCGLHGLFQGLEVVLDAAERLRVDHPRIKFVLVGDGPTKSTLMDLASAAGLDNVIFRDPVPRSEVPAVLASCDVALVPLAAELPGTMPSKVYETLASGVPLIVTEGCEAAPLIKAHGVGRTFRPLDADGLSGAVLDLFEHPEERIRIGRDARVLAERFDFERVALDAESTLRAVVEGMSPRVD